ncbi:MAG TPA: Dyp-type peroxidase [Pyrinomonadaceae bacterium]|nr:Dyp-type peroxidase [Pyrinomonadaceae bacterium]
MPIDFSESKAYDPKDIQDLLESIQGNILKGHGRDHTIHIFVKFNAANNVKNLRKKLVAVTKETIKSAWQQHVESEQYRKYKIPGAVFGNIFLTLKGYRKLGFTDEQLKTAFTDNYSRDGMPATHNDFKDPAPAKWDEGYNGAIDAMFLLADDDKDFLLRRGRELINALDEFCEILVVERGEALRNKENNEGIEHFGYVDGRSQPIYLTTDLKNEGTTEKWNPVEPLNIVLTDDKLAGDGNWGSYFVFRKLEQDVLSFKTREQKLADELGFTTKEERERAGALAVGRFEDGTPIVLSPTDGYIPVKENDFDYSIDDDRPDPADPTKTIPGGLKCPYQAHIRKTNPRGDTVRRFSGVSDRDERNHRVTRRGITYGERKKHPNDAQALSDYPTKGVGLLFMCFQASIENQFAFMQIDWANDSNFVKDETGLDPIIGQGSGNDQKWRQHYGQPAGEEIEFSFQGFVEMKGGEFFFAPSIKFLKTFAPPAA